MLKGKNLIPLRCQHCNYRWNYTGPRTHGITTCPNPECKRYQVRIHQKEFRKIHHYSSEKVDYYVNDEKKKRKILNIESSPSK